jgi:diguanylate cyclase (GGDEF)-like protein/PAS domain S-box-containing protein
VQLLRDSDGQPLFFINAIQDITERKHIEQHLRDSEEKLRLLIKKMPLALGLTNERDELIFINDRFQSIFGYSLADLPTIEHWWSLAYPDENYRQQVIATWITAVKNAARLGTDIEPLEYRITCKDGIERVMLVSGIDFADGHIYTYIDITERKAAEEEIKQLAFFDPLTGLPNRRKLLDRLQYAISLNHRTNSQFAVFMLDLDKFKPVNDKLGHAAGDELLKQVSARITACLRSSDMVARLGGDEFVLVLENLKVPEDAEIIALKVIAELTVPFQLSENNTVQIGASIGISLYPQHGNTPEILIDHADTALYQAKDNGCGCFAYFLQASKTT